MRILYICVCVCACEHAHESQTAHRPVEKLVNAFKFQIRAKKQIKILAKKIS